MMEDFKMNNADNLKKDYIYKEAIERMELLGINNEHRRLFTTNKKFIKTAVDHDKKIIRKMEATYEETQMVQKWEKENNSIVYYLIQDNGLWPDGCTFLRYTLLYVDACTKDYKMVKEDCILKYGTVPAYIINIEDSRYSEYGEILFMNVNGFLANIS